MSYGSPWSSGESQARTPHSGRAVAAHPLSRLPKSRAARLTEGRFVVPTETSETRIDFAILDELGYLPFAQAGRPILFYLVSRLYERTSIIVATNSRSADGPASCDTKMTTVLLCADFLVGRADLGPFNDFNWKWQGAGDIGPLIRQRNF